MAKSVGILAFIDPSMGGVVQYTRSLANALALDPSLRPVVHVPIGSRDFSDLDVEVREVPAAGMQRAAKLARLACVVGDAQRDTFLSAEERAHFADIDVFVATTTSFYPHFYLRKPYVYTLHDLQERHYPEYFTPSRRAMRRLMRTRCAEHASRILCESRFVRDDIVRYLGIPTERIAVVEAPPPRDFLDARFTAGQLEAIRTKYQLPGRYFFYPAQFWPHKNHARLIEAMAVLRRAHPDVHLVLTGGGAHAFRDVLARVGALGLQDRVVFLGQVDYAALPALYQLACGLVMPTLFESVSIPIYEAFATGAPVCASRVVGLPEQVGDAALLFDPDDPADIARQMARLLEEPGLARALVERGRARLTGFDHASYAGRLREVIASA